MPIPHRRLVPEKELQEILSALDTILSKRPVKKSEAEAPPVPPAPASTPAAAAPPAPIEPKPSPAVRPAPSAHAADAPLKPAPKPAPPPPAAPRAARSFQSLDAPILPAPKAPKPAEREAVFPDEAIPKGAGKEQIRRIAVLYTEDSHREIGELIGLLQELGRNVSKQTIYLTKVSVEKINEASSAKALALKARLAEAVAVIGILKGLSRERMAEWTEAMAKQRLHFHAVAPEDIHRRPVVIDLMISLLVIDPCATPQHFTWEDHGHSEKHGIRREDGY